MAEGQATGLACAGCGRDPMLRNGRREITVPRISGEGVTWHRLVAARFVCRGCGRSATDRDCLRAKLEATLRREIVRRLAMRDLVDVAAWAGCDPRTAAGNACREMDHILRDPLPPDLSIETGGRLALLVEARTRVVADVSPPESESICRILADRGGGIERVALPLDPALRDAVAETLPGTSAAIHRCDGIARLDALLRDARARPDGGVADLLWEGIRLGGWDVDAVGKLADIGVRQGSRMVGLFLRAWGGEVREMLLHPRDGPTAPLRIPDPVRARALVASAHPRGVTVDQLLAALASDTAKRTNHR